MDTNGDINHGSVATGRRMRELLENTPRKFQIRGVKFLERCNGRALIADQMGGCHEPF